MSLKLSKKQREELRMKFGGRCAYCGCQLPEKGWHADHVKAVYRETEIDREAWERGQFKLKQTGDVFKPEHDCFENLFPACAPCNLFKSTFSINQFRFEIGKQADRARDYSVNFRTAERFGMVHVIVKPIVFWFEEYETHNKK